MKTNPHLGFFLPVCLAAAAFFNSGCASTDPTTRVVFPGVTINHHAARLLLDTGSDSAWLNSTGGSRLGVKAQTAALDTPVNGIHTEAISLSEPLPVVAGAEAFDAQLPVDTAPWVIRWLLPDDFDGYVGWPDVRGNILVFDPARRTINGVEKLPEATAGWLKLGLGPTDVFTLEVPLPDGTVGNILVDTGDPMGVGLPTPQWQEWRAAHAHARLTTRETVTPGIGNLKCEEAWADEIKLGNIVLTDVPVYEEPSAVAAEFDNFAGAFGMYALSRMDLVVDAKNNSAYLHAKPSPGPPYPGIKRPGVSQDADHGKEANKDWVVGDGVALRREKFLLRAARDKTFGKNYDGAIADCTTALSLDPKDADAFLLRGSAKDGKDDYQGALADFNLALELDPHKHQILLARGQLELAHQDPATAIADFDQVLAREPKNSGALSGRAEARQIYGDFAGAVADFGAAAKVNPDSSNYFRLYSHLLQMRMGSAPADFTNTIAGWKKGWTKSLGRFVTGAIDEKALLAASAKSDEEPVTGQKCEAYYFIGMLRLLKGDQAGAREFWEKCVATEQKDYYEYNFARGELARLKAAAK